MSQNDQVLARAWQLQPLNIPFLKNHPLHEALKVAKEKMNGIIEKNYKLASDNLPPPPLSVRATELAKWNSDNENRMFQVGLEIVSRTAYLFVLFSMSNILRTDNQYNWFLNTRDNLFPKNGLNTAFQIRTIPDVWNWLNGTGLNFIYPELDFLGNRLKWKERKNMRTLTSFRVGPVRLRQIRQKLKRCELLETNEISTLWKFGPCESKTSVKPGSWFNEKLTVEQKVTALADQDISQEAWHSVNERLKH